MYSHVQRKNVHRCFFVKTIQFQLEPGSRHKSVFPKPVELFPRSIQLPPRNGAPRYQARYYQHNAFRWQDSLNGSRRQWPRVQGYSRFAVRNDNTNGSGRFVGAQIAATSIVAPRRCFISRVMPGESGPPAINCALSRLPLKQPPLLTNTRGCVRNEQTLFEGCDSPRVYAPRLKSVNSGQQRRSSRRSEVLVQFLISDAYRSAMLNSRVNWEVDVGGALGMIEGKRVMEYVFRRVQEKLSLCGTVLW